MNESIHTMHFQQCPAHSMGSIDDSIVIVVVVAIIIIHSFNN